MKTFVMGDIHGAYRAMTPVLQLAGFDYENDRLIQIGDVVDGWPDAVVDLEELMKIKKRIAVRGNHDCWLYNWLSSGRHDIHWSEFGGNVTMSDSIRKEKEDDKRHLRFLKNQYTYFIDEYDSANLVVAVITAHAVLQQRRSKGFLFNYFKKRIQLFSTSNRMSFSVSNDQIACGNYLLILCKSYEINTFG